MIHTTRRTRTMYNVRFQATYNALRDSYEHLWDDGLSTDEEAAMESLVRLCRDIVKEVGERYEEEKEETDEE
jgi:hypothetical protein